MYFQAILLHNLIKKNLRNRYTKSFRQLNVYITSEKWISPDKITSLIPKNLSEKLYSFVDSNFCVCILVKSCTCIHIIIANVCTCIYDDTYKLSHKKSIFISCQGCISLCVLFDTIVYCYYTSSKNTNKF